jgi:hypothetical protein
MIESGNVAIISDSLLKRGVEVPWISFCDFWGGDCDLIVDANDARTSKYLLDVDLSIYDKIELCVSNLGIVDAAPRIYDKNVSYDDLINYSCSIDIVGNDIRKFLRDNRYDLLYYIYNKNGGSHNCYVTVYDYIKNISSFVDNNKCFVNKFVFISILKPHSWHEQNRHFLASDCINKYNDTLESFCDNNKNVYFFNFEEQLGKYNLEYGVNFSCDDFMCDDIDDDGYHIKYEMFETFARIFDFFVKNNVI